MVGCQLVLAEHLILCVTVELRTAKKKGSLVNYTSALAEIMLGARGGVLLGIRRIYTEA
jgi:hypothetical protein